METSTLLTQLRKLLRQDPAGLEPYYDVIDDFTSEDCDYDDQQILTLVCSLVDCAGGKPLLAPVAAIVKKVLEDGAKMPDYALELGSLYYKGVLDGQDFAKAVKYYRMAAAAGSETAAENLGYCYRYGRSVPTDYEKAYQYFAQGAMLGRPVSLANIGDMYRHGCYVAHDDRLAFKMYARAYDLADRADPDGIIDPGVCRRMGDAYYEGIGTAVDLHEALAFYQQAEQAYYYDIQDGDFFVCASLSDVISRISDIRKQLSALLPDFSWTKK
mgnify:CR=1 FL=1